MATAILGLVRLTTAGVRARHQIYAGGKNVDLSETTHNLVLDADAVAKGKQKDLDDLGIAKNAREEKLRARKIEVHANEKSAEDERMAALYRQHVLKEQAPEPVIKGVSLTLTTQSTTLGGPTRGDHDRQENGRRAWGAGRFVHPNRCSLDSGVVRRTNLRR